MKDSYSKKYPKTVEKKDTDCVMHGESVKDKNAQWQVNVDITPSGNGIWPSGSFLPMSGKNRAQPHTKLNECDH